MTITSDGNVNVSSGILLKVQDTTESTSTSTGALIVSGGVGIAKSLRVGSELHVGGDVSIGGTLTYEDVTNVDSVGLITAKSGVNITGGELTVGSGITMGIVGVATFSGTSDVHLVDNVQLNFGNGKEGDIYRDSAQMIINNDGGNLKVRSASVHIAGLSNEKHIVSNTGVGVTLFYNNSAKIETTNDGTVTTGIATATGLSISGTSSFGGDVTFAGAAANITFDQSVDDLIFNDDARAVFGTDEDLKIRHSSGNSIISHGGAGDLLINTGAGEKIYIDTSEVIFRNASSNETLIQATENSDVELYFDNSLKFQTTYEGTKITGFTSTTAGMGVTGGLYEGSFIKAGKLSDNLQIGIATANVFYFTTTETATATPNIRWNDTYSLSSKMAVGDVASVTVITTAAAAAYAANWTIDGNAVTEEWVGGSAPSAGGADGLDIYSLTIIKTGTGTGDSGFKVIANVSNAT